MINSIDFINRLKKIMLTHQITASSFADIIGVQRSSISHILSGRNKPSLDFILKITSKFTDVDIYWLLNGKGTYPKRETTNTQTPTPTSTPSLTPDQTQTNTSKKIQRIVVFYKDGTFEEYFKE